MLTGWARRTTPQNLGWMVPSRGPAGGTPLRLTVWSPSGPGRPYRPAEQPVGRNFWAGAPPPSNRGILGQEQGWELRDG